MQDDRSSTLMAAQLRAVSMAMGLGGVDLPASTGLTAMIAHGGIYTLGDSTGRVSC